ncbi:MAG TPA: hypothetical protein VHR27_08455, partial [Blastocatellia bacterium]|nr:hypothetical protein [Blastocatellia bacterium]
KRFSRMGKFEGLTVLARPSINRNGSYPNIRTVLAQQLPISYVNITHLLWQRENENGKSSSGLAQKGTFNL